MSIKQFLLLFACRFKLGQYFFERTFFADVTCIEFTFAAESVTWLKKSVWRRCISPLLRPKRDFSLSSLRPSK
jgi:hypothetical protein